jgi:hypothetical protein
MLLVRGEFMQEYPDKEDSYSQKYGKTDCILDFLVQGF